jgi:hypothetical protein
VRFDYSGRGTSLSTDAYFVNDPNTSLEYDDYWTTFVWGYMYMSEFYADHALMEKFASEPDAEPDSETGSSD